MERLVSTDNVKIHVTVELELNVLLKITDLSVSAHQDMLVTHRSLVNQLDASLMEIVETERLVSQVTVSTHVWYRTHVEDLLSVIHLDTELTADACLDMKEIHLLDVKSLDVALIQSALLTRLAETRTVLILVSMRIHVPRMLNVLSVTTSLNVDVLLATLVTPELPVYQYQHQNVSRIKTVHHNTPVLITSVACCVLLSAHVETLPLVQ